MVSISPNDTCFHILTLFTLLFLCLIILTVNLKVTQSAESDSVENEDEITVEANLKKEASSTDAEALKREEEAIKLDGLNVAQMRELRESAEKFAFQAEVNRMMKLIINSLYRNKDIFLRELISNASDALDKIRVLSLTDSSKLEAQPELSIKIKADKDTNTLHIIDTGVGMTKQELINNLGTIAKSGTSEFLQKVGGSEDISLTDLNDMIGQFGVGFYSAFLVADRVVVTSKSNEDEQHVWESDSSSFSVNKDPRGPTLKRGTQVTLHLKEESRDFLQEDTLKNLIIKYSQFINFPIYVWSSRTETVEEPAEDEPTPTSEAENEVTDKDEEAKIEEEKEEKPKSKKVEKTIWEWDLVNLAKPIWTRKPTEIEDKEYDEFYKSLTKDSSEPLAKTHFIAEGEVTFKSLLYIPKTQPSESFNKYGTKTDHIKLYVRRVFITDDFQDIMPNYLNFIRGVVDSDDLPLNVSRETLQQHKLLKVIKKKLVRKALDMMKKIPEEDYAKFWEEYGTNLKLGAIEDTSNRTRLAKLLRFQSSSLPQGKLTSLEEYVKRMKEKQDYIYYIAGTSFEEVSTSPFVEKLLKKGYEVLYLVEPVDEYCFSSIPEFEEKKFQNVAKDGLKVDDSTKEKLQELEKQFQPLTSWLEKDVLKDKISKASVSARLHESPCALVASQYGWTGNMERLARSNAHSKKNDPTRTYYLSQKKSLDINPRHPIIKEMLKRVESDKDDQVARNMAHLMFDTATLRSGFMLQDTASFATRIETLLRKTLNIDESAVVDEEEEEDFKPVIEESLNKETEDREHDEHDEF